MRASEASSPFVDIELATSTTSSPNPGVSSSLLTTSTLPVAQKYRWTTTFLEFASSWSTQAFLVDTCLSVSVVSYFRLFLAVNTQSTQELKVVCDAVRSVADHTWPPSDLIDLVAVCDTPLGAKFPILAPLSTSTNYIILLVFLVKAIAGIHFLRPAASTCLSWRLSWLLDVMDGYTSIPAEFSRPFEMVVVSVTVHSLLGFALFATPLLRSSGVAGLLPYRRESMELMAFLLVAVATWASIWSLGGYLVKKVRRGRIMLGDESGLEDEEEEELVGQGGEKKECYV